MWALVIQADSSSHLKKKFDKNDFFPVLFPSHHYPSMVGALLYIIQSLLVLACVTIIPFTPTQFEFDSWYYFLKAEVFGVVELQSRVYDDNFQTTKSPFDRAMFPFTQSRSCKVCFFLSSRWHDRHYFVAKEEEFEKSRLHIYLPQAQKKSCRTFAVELNQTWIAGFLSGRSPDWASRPRRQKWLNLMANFWR